MIDSLKVCERLQNGNFENITLDDCLVYIEVFSYNAAILIKRLSNSNQSRCFICRDKVLLENTNDMFLSGEVRKLCKDCFLEFRYEEMWGI